MERLKADDVLFAVCVTNDGLVYIFDSNFWLQTSLWVPETTLPLNLLQFYLFTGSDVLAGALLGVGYAFIIKYCITNFGRRRSCDKLPTTNSELNSKNTIENSS